MDIKIRKSEPEDARSIKEIYECQGAYESTLQLPHPTVDMWTKRMSNIPDHVHSYASELDEKVVGNLGLEVCSNYRRRHVASFGMELGMTY